MAQTDLTTAFTDLLAGILLIPAIFSILFRKTERKTAKKYWILMLSFLSVSFLLGFAAHYLFKDGIINRIIWVPLYATMFETLNMFFLLSVNLHPKNGMPNKRLVLAVHLFSMILCAVTVFLSSVKGYEMIRTFSVYGIVFALAGFAFFVKSAFAYKKKSAILMLSSLVPLLIGAYFQVDRRAFIHIIWDFNCNGITHIFLIIGLYIVYRAAVCSLKEK